MRKLSILVIIALLSAGSASISDKVKETGQNMKEHAEDVLETTQERAKAAKDFASAQFHENNADIKEGLHRSQDSSFTSRDSAQDSINRNFEQSQNNFDSLQEKSQAGKDFASGKFHEIKADAAESFHAGKDSLKDAANRVGEGSLNAFQRSQGLAQSQQSQSQTPNKDFSSTGQEFKQSTEKQRSQDIADRNLRTRTGLSSFTLVLLSLILGVLFFMSFGHSASIDKMKGKFFQARGNVKKEFDHVADKAKAGYHNAKAKSRSAAREY